MCNDIELFKNLIYLTEVMNNLFHENLQSYLECIELTQDLNNFKTINDILKLNNKNINNAIKEILENNKFIQIIKENTKINIDEIKV